MAQEGILDIVHKYIDLLEKEYTMKKIFLFGSYVKGNFHEDSDIDIAIVFDDFENRIDMQLELMHLTRNIDSRIEPHPFREKDFSIEDPLVYEILKYGKEIKRVVV